MENRKKVDKRLRKKYGISLEEYEQRLEEQGWVCKICLRPPKNNRLSVDHDHKLRYTKISTIKLSQKFNKYSWVAWALGKRISEGGTTKNNAIKACREKLKSESVRGLLCFRCNSGLQKYSDDPIRLQSAANYLLEYQGRIKVIPPEV